MALNCKNVRIQGKYLELTESITGKRYLLNPATILFVEEYDGYCILFTLDDETFIIEDAYDNIIHKLVVQL